MVDPKGMSRSEFLGFENGRLGVDLYSREGVDDPAAFDAGLELGREHGEASANEIRRAELIRELF